MKTISILGTGWLGLQLVRCFTQLEYRVNASTRSNKRVFDIEQEKATGFVVDIENLSANIQKFLNSHILIVNITSKNIEAFMVLIKEIEKSSIENIIFVSSSSVYKNLNRVVSEDERAEDENSVLYQIENHFRSKTGFKTTVVRFSGLIGYGRHPGRFFKNGKIVQQANAPVNLIHRDDCVGIIKKIVEQEVWGEVLNASASTHPAKKDFYSDASRSIGFPVPEFSTEGALSYKIIANEKLQQLLNYKFIYPDLMSICFEKMSLH